MALVVSESGVNTSVTLGGERLLKAKAERHAGHALVWQDYGYKYGVVVAEGRRVYELFYARIED